jgi:LPXTG-motif cell wall-anchored protein
VATVGLADTGSDTIPALAIAGGLVALGLGAWSSILFARRKRAETEE